LVATPSTSEQRALRWIDVNARKTKIERLIDTRLVIADIREVAKSDARAKNVSRWIDVQLVPNHLSIRECSRMIRTPDYDLASKCYRD
jgi:hypothetical protein